MSGGSPGAPKKGALTAALATVAPSAPGPNGPLPRGRRNSGAFLYFPAYRSSMSDHDSHGDEAPGGHGHGDVETAEDERTTAPMQSFTGGQVGTGFVVLLVGLVVVFGVPLLL